MRESTIKQHFEDALTVSFQKSFDKMSLQPEPVQKKEVIESAATNLFVSATLNCNFFKSELALVISPTAAAAIACSMLGETEISDVELCEDAIQELLNILTGQIKQHLSTQGYTFDLCKISVESSLSAENLSKLSKPECFKFESALVKNQLGGVWSLKSIVDPETQTETAATVTQIQKQKDALKNFIPVALTDFKIGVRLLFDVYIYLPLNQKIILYKGSDSVMDQQTVEKFQRYSFEGFYVPEEQRESYLSYLCGKIGDLLENKPNSTKEEQRKIRKDLHNQMNQVLGSFYKADPEMQEELFSQLAEVNQRIVKSFLDSKDPYLAILKVFGQNRGDHPTGAHTLALAVLIGLGYRTQKALSDMGIAALLHDIGLADPSTKASTEGYQDHPLIAVKMIDNYKTKVSDESRLIISQHHENIDGTGYPCQLSSMRIYELAKIFSIVDELEEVVSARDKEKPMKISDALKILIESNNTEGKPQKFDNKILRQVTQLFIPNAK